jgi:DNA-binding transcriptional LysR family regulator
MDLRAVEAFVWVARLGQFRAAARKLNVTQPAISTRVSLMERELGVRLFERGAQQVALTQKGRELLEPAERMLQLREQMRFSADPQVAVRGQLRLGVSETLVHTWFPALVQRIEEHFPLLTLEMQVDVKPNMLKALAARQLDIAFVTRPVDTSGFAEVDLCTYPLAWMASPSLRFPRGPVTLEMVTKRPVVTYARNSRPLAFIEGLFAREGITGARIYTSWSMSTTLTMVMNGFGVGTLPLAAASQELADGRLRVLDVRGAELPSFDFVAVYPQEPDSFVTAAVAQLAREAALADTARAGVRRRTAPTRPPA